MKKMTVNFNGKKVLVADDYYINQELTKELLKLMGCEVDVAEDGPSTLEQYKLHQYDIIMMDVQMPEIDGYEVTRRIREIENSTGKKRTVIIALTANALPDDRQKCIKAGMDDYISKPVTTAHLEKKLSEYLL